MGASDDHTSPRDNYLSCDMQMLKERCAENRCKCRKAGFTRTDLCSCLDTGEDCKNKLFDVNDDDYNDEDDGESEY